MLLRGLKGSPVLDFVEFPTLDEFEAFDRLGQARNTPISGQCSSGRAHIELPHCQLTVQRTFPRVLDVKYRISGLLFGVPLLPSVKVKVNGVEGNSSKVMIVQGDVACEIFEPQANLFAILNLAPSISQRDWSATSPDSAYILDVLDAEALQSFKQTVVSLLALTSLQPTRVEPIPLLAIEEKLLSSFDEAMHSHIACPSPGQFEKYRRIVRRMDEYLEFHQAENTYLPELARACGVSLRTLQAATKAVRGMSAYRYLRLRRLWLVRKMLASSRASSKVSDVARAHGFWHMSEFSAAYRATYNESPSMTVARRQTST